MDSGAPGRAERDVGSSNAAAWVGVILGVPAAILAVLVLVSYLGDADDETSGSAQRTEQPASRTSDSPETGADDAGDGATGNPEADDGDPVGVDSADGCEVVVANPLATIHEDPDVFSQEVTRVPAGTYGVQETQVVTSPVDTQRWFRLDVDGRSGWLRDSTFDVASKSAACP